MGDCIKIFFLDCENSYKEIKKVINNKTDIKLKELYKESAACIYQDEYMITLVDQTIEIFSMENNKIGLENLAQEIIRISKEFLNMESISMVCTIDNITTKKYIDTNYRPSIKSKIKKTLFTALERI